MSMLNRPANSAETGEIVASMRDYEAAQKAVSQLIAEEVPARDIAIIGQSVRTVERVTGKLGYAAAARSGAVNGILIGLFLSAILVLGNPEVPIQLFVGFVFIGVALGMLLSLVTYAIIRRRRDFASVTQFAADHYEVTVLSASLAKARQVLGAHRPAPVRPPVDLDEPPRYGERIPAGGSAQPAPAPPAAPPVTTPAGGPAAPPQPVAPPAAPPAGANPEPEAPSSSPVSPVAPGEVPPGEAIPGDTNPGGAAPGDVAPGGAR